MGFFKYPYTDLNELNLDWVIAKIKYIEQAKNIIYDNTGTPLISNNVQDAIDEIYNMISTQGVTTWNGRSGVVVPEAGDYTATQVTYDNTNTGYVATDVQTAIDEADTKMNGIAAQIPATIVEDFNGRSGSVTPAAGDYNGTQVTYDNTLSGLTATDLQGAVDELAAAPGGVTSFNNRTGAVVPAASDYTAAQVDFDDTVAQTGSSNVQGALQYVATRGSSAALTTYDNTQSGLTATNVQDAIDEVANDVLSSGVASFNGRTGAVNPAIGDYDLTELGDVAISTPAQDEVLKYDAVSQKWVNGAGGGGANTLSGLTDVNLGALTDGDQFIYDSASSKWINVPADYELVGRVTFQSGTTSDTYLNKLTAVATAALTALQAEGNDVMYQASTLSIGGSSFAATNAAFFNNTDTSIGTTYTDLQVASNGVLHGYMVRSSSTANNSYYRHDQVSVGSPCNNSFTDSTSGTTTAQVTMYMLKFKKK